MKKKKRFFCPCNNCHALRRALRPTSNSCYLCRTKDIFIFMVSDKVWYQAKVPHQEIVCIACLEKAMSRKLTILDFKDVPINRDIFDGFLGTTSSGFSVNRNLLGEELRKRLTLTH